MKLIFQRYCYLIQNLQTQTRLVPGVMGTKAPVSRERYFHRKDGPCALLPLLGVPHQDQRIKSFLTEDVTSWGTLWRNLAGTGMEAPHGYQSQHQMCFAIAVGVGTAACVVVASQELQHCNANLPGVMSSLVQQQHNHYGGKHPLID